MKDRQLISTAIVLLLLGATLPALAQKREEEKGGDRAPQAQHQSQPQHAQQAQHARPAQRQAPPQRMQQAERQPQRTQPVHRRSQPQRAQTRQPVRQQTRTAAYRGDNGNRGGGQYGRISSASYNSHFGHEHYFHMGRPQFVGGYNRFQYGGYWFGYNQAWPVGWGYNDNVYVVYEGGGYYMYNLMHPGFHISLNIF